ncbi:MAG: DUF1553 domain-containing protein [Planctomycetota bacterium]|nr:MAG: DUF1553 domain-containing protein [Planctomycetota bacterium]
MLVVGFCCGAVAARADDAAGADVEFFEKHVRPLLVSRCQECHSGAEPKGGLRVDSRKALLTGGDTGPAVVPGDADESLLIDAVRYGDLYQMPPKSQLPAAEVATLEEWVRRGAPWGAETADSPAAAAEGFDLQARAAHWCFQPLADPTPPDVDDSDWIKTPVDRFILHRLHAAGLEPAPPAGKRTLLRRVTFDLTGLPPTLEEIDAFLADDSPDAYATVVDRLLASPHYGERWARHWLDLVRYAETHGHEFDFEIPHAYRYRDYVIRALNDDLPYDQFVVEHVAGDLLPEPRINRSEGINESIIATGWYYFGEALHSPVDVRADEANRIDNQIDVFSKALLGLTVSCARCHDHKFDPISTRDYYALAGYFQSSRYQQAIVEVDETRAKAVAELERLNAERQEACLEFARAKATEAASEISEALQTSPTAAEQPNAALDDPLFVWNALTREGRTPEAFATRRQTLRIELQDRRERATADADGNWADFRSGDYAPWEATGQAFGSGPGMPFDWPFAAPQSDLPGRLLCAATAHSGLVSRKLHGTLRSPTFEITAPKIWYRVYGEGARVRLILDGLQLIRNPIYGGLEFQPKQQQPYWHEQDVSKWIGHRAYIELIDDGDGYVALEQVAFSDGPPPEPTPNAVLVEMLADDSIVSPEALADKYTRTAQRVLTDWLKDPNATTHDAGARASIVAWLLRQPGPSAAKAHERLAPTLGDLARRQREIEARLTPPRYCLAMCDGTAENEHVFIRGNHKTLGEEVPRRLLEVLSGKQHAPPTAGSGRLALARQLVSPECPLVPRVIVNRLWHHHFGTGLVRSPDNFGVMGEKPTHPALLDFLAQELVDHDWSLKHVHRLMVLSNTYRMSSRVDAEADRADPRNERWHRMTVRRLEAESIRDAILFTSGRLDPTMYGPGVMPYLTEYMTGRGRPAESGPLDGDGRRSIYLAVRRNFLSPMFLAFDYPTPFTTIGRRGSSNVPAQALVMMNNPFVIEQAQHWARRIVEEDAAPEERIRRMYLAALAREPDASELNAALGFVESNDEQAWAELAHVLYNVKEFIFIR